MLQRAASNAYSWWAASHLRTSQSKWLDGNLQEMEDRVQSMLKIIEEDADSFAKRAEMYYKKRPELINYVEETYRAYRALAERYDRISGELHKANNTLATAFPDLEFPMQDEDDEFSPARSPMDSIEAHSPTPPEFPQISLLNKRNEKKPAPKKSIEKLQSKPQKSKATTYTNEDEAKEAIDRIQKGILALQTEKEFIKSSYERGITKCWEIEKQITEMQQEVTSLQDDFGVSSVIEDDEARALMAVTALKSCKDTLFNLQKLQRRSVEDAKIESERIKAAKQKLMALKGEPAESDEKIEDISYRSTGIHDTAMNMEEESHYLQPESPELQLMGEKVNDHFEINSDTSVVELAEKIDELVNKVIGLELTVSSQAAQIKLLKSETDDLQKHLRSLEEEKESTSDESSSLNDQLKEAEEKLHKIQALEERVKHEKSMLHSVLAEASHSLSDISEKLQSPRQQGHVKPAGPSQGDNRSTTEAQEKSDEKEIMETKDTNAKVKEGIHTKGQENNIQSAPVCQQEIDSGKSLMPKQGIRERNLAQDTASNYLSNNPEEESGERVEASNLAQLLLSGLEGKENTLLAEYTSILKSYTETKRKLLEVEKKNQEYFSETMAHVTELKSANTVKDDEIQSLRQIVSSLQIKSKPQKSEISEGLDMEGANRKDMASHAQDWGSRPAEQHINLYNTDEPHSTSAIEEKFRRDIDTLLDENLEFWLRFSTSFHQIQRFRTEFQDLQAEIEKLKDRKLQEGSSSSSEQAGKPEPIDKQLRELKTELQVWIEQSDVLRRELQTRFTSLCDIQEEISRVLKASAEADLAQFTPYQAAKFQGEILNMKQENNKVADELQSGLDHVKGLQTEVEKTLSTWSKLHEKFQLSSSKHHSSHNFRHLSAKSRGVPLRSFLYGVKPKKPSIFSCMSPALQKQYSDLKAGMPI